MIYWYVRIKVDHDLTSRHRDVAASLDGSDWGNPQTVEKFRLLDYYDLSDIVWVVVWNIFYFP